MQKADSNSSAGANADSEQKAEVPTSSQHSSKPHVVGSQCTCTQTHPIDESKWIEFESISVQSHFSPSLSSKAFINSSIEFSSSSNSAKV